MNGFPLMKCGHAGMAVDQATGQPVCVICYPDPEASEVVSVLPDLTGRTARCSYYAQCHSEVPSDFGLPFFTYHGPGGHNTCANCHYLHAPGTVCPTVYNNTGRPIPGAGKWAGLTYREQTKEHDEYYCGCYGWD